MTEVKKRARWGSWSLRLSGTVWAEQRDQAWVLGSQHPEEQPCGLLSVTSGEP